MPVMSRSYVWMYTTQYLVTSERGHTSFLCKLIQWLIKTISKRGWWGLLYHLFSKAHAGIYCREKDKLKSWKQFICYDSTTERLYSKTESPS